MEPTGTAYASQSAWANVSNFNSTVFWAEVGWIKFRSAGSTTITKAVFGEIGTGDTSEFIFGPIPDQDSQHTYKCELTDATNGTWTYYLDGAPFGTKSETEWKNQVGTDVEYNGEIYNKEDDMPGTPTDQCLFDNCQYKSNGGSYEAVAFAATGDIVSNDSTMWGATWLSSNSFEIWDINP